MAPAGLKSSGFPVMLRPTGVPMKFEPTKKLEATKQWLANDGVDATKRFWRTDMRWSYIASGILVVVGLITSFFLPHGWTVWPFVAVGGMMMMVHEAADRNGEGIPPLTVYAFFFGVITVWVIVMAILSVTNPLILILGISGLAFYCGREYIKQRERMKVIEKRRADGCCIYCGELADPNLGVCMNCGNDPDPATTQLARVASIVKGSNNAAHARAVIKGETTGQIATRKERALLAARSRNLPTKKK